MTTLTTDDVSRVGNLVALHLETAVEFFAKPQAYQAVGEGPLADAMRKHLDAYFSGVDTTFTALRNMVSDPESLEELVGKLNADDAS